MINRSLLRNYLESVFKVSKFLKSVEVWSLGLKSSIILIIQLNVPTDLRLFKGKLKPLQACRIKKIYQGGYQLMKNVDYYGCLTKKSCQLNSSFVGVGDVSFHYKLGFF